MAVMVAGLTALSVLLITWALAPRSHRSERRPPLLTRQNLALMGRYLSQHFPEILTLEHVNRQLIWAGRPHQLEATEFLGLRAVAAGGGAILGLAAGGLTGAVVGAIMGAIYPGVWLQRQVRRRQLQIARDLSKFLALWTAAVEAGLDLMPAVERVCRRLPGPLATEFQLALQEVSIGYPPAMALKHVADRCGVADLTQVVSLLIGADRWGTSVAEQLRVATRELSGQRTARARAKAGQISVLMRGPMLACELPGLLILMLAPVMWQMQILFR